MTRLLFLCLLLLLPASADVPEDVEGSADDPDDEELDQDPENIPGLNKTTGVDENQDRGYMIIIVAAGVVLTLSVIVAVAMLIVRCKMQQREQGVYSVPTEQDQKGAV